MYCLTIYLLITTENNKKKKLKKYKLNLKTGLIVMLLRNLSVNKGLYNGTRIDS